MPPYKLRLTPEQEARYKEVCARPPKYVPLPKISAPDSKSVDIEILRQVEIYTREYREDLPYEERVRIRNSVSRLRQKGLIVNKGVQQYPKWARTPAGDALLAEEGF